MNIATRAVSGVPYLQKVLARRISMRTGWAFTTPTTYYVLFGGKCNLRCLFCNWYNVVDPTLPEEAMLRIIREARELSGKGFNINLSGGEPMLYEPLYAALDLSQQLGVDFGFTTNGLALTRANVQKVISYDPFNINISLESVDPKVNEVLRPFHGGTRRTLDAVEAVLKEKERTGSRVAVMVKPIIMEQNYRGLPDLVRYFGKHSKVQVHFQPYTGRSGQPFWVRDLEDLRRVFSELLDLRREGYSVVGDEALFDGFYKYFSNPPDEGGLQYLELGGQKRNCDIGLRTMLVMPNGDVNFCDLLKQPIGNVHRNSLSEIYHGQTAVQQRCRMVYCNIDCQATCKRPVPLLVKVKTYLKMR
jgi:MoaA/NifB/PqqE/SkfB family radical SAM enzyme